MAAGFGTTLGDLLGASPPTPAEAPALPQADHPPSPAYDLSLCTQIVLAISRKGRRGKTVTLLSGLEFSPEQLAELARHLRRGLGVGTTVDGDQVALQGDIRERVADWLRAQGAREVKGIAKARR